MIALAVDRRVQQAFNKDLDFRGKGSPASTVHALHSFPSRFPPQLPAHFIEALTKPGDVVMDPMAGSGTTVLEAVPLGRHGLGFDLDPLSVLQCSRPRSGRTWPTCLREG